MKEDDSRLSVNNDQKMEGKGKMGWVSAGLVMFGFAAPSACVGVAYSVGASGLLLAPLLCILVTVTSGTGALFLFHLGRRHPGCDSLPLLGEAVAGDFGRTFGMVIQQGNFVLYLPVAVLVCAQAAQDAIDPTYQYLEGCVDYWILIVGGVCLATTQLRSLNNVTTLSFVSLACVVIVIVFALVIVSETDNIGKEEADLFGNPQMSSGYDGLSPIDRKAGWSTFMLGVSTTAWCYVPTFLTVELANEKVMANPDDFPKAILFSGALNCVVYIVVGVYVVSRWGWNVMDPLMLGTWPGLVGMENADGEKLGPDWPAENWKARWLNVAWFVGCLISYALDSVPLARQCQRSWDPKFNIDDWSFAACMRYLGITLPTFLAAIIMALFVPSLFCMLAIVTALTVPWVNNIFPAYLYLASGSGQNEYKVDTRVSYADADKSTEGHESGFGYNRLRGASEGENNKALPLAWATWPVLLIGVLVFLVCTIGAVGKLGIESLRGPVTVGCQGWMILDE